MTPGNVLRTLNGIFVNSVNKLNKCIINKMKKNNNNNGIYGSDDLRDQTPGQGRGQIDYHFHFIKNKKTKNKKNPAMNGYL